MDAEFGETDAAEAAQQNVPVVPEPLSGRIDASVDTGSGIRQKSGSTKGVEW